MTESVIENWPVVTTQLYSYNELLRFRSLDDLVDSWGDQIIWNPINAFALHHAVELILRHVCQFMWFHICLGFGGLVIRDKLARSILDVRALAVDATRRHFISCCNSLDAIVCSAQDIIHNI